MDALWKVPPRVAAAWRRNISIVFPKKLSWALFAPPTDDRIQTLPGIIKPCTPKLSMKRYTVKSNFTRNNENKNPKFPRNHHALNPKLSRHHLSNPKPGHTTGGSVWGGARRVGAGMGSTGRRRDGSPRRKPPLLPSRRCKNNLLGVSLEARTKEILFKPMGEQNPRLTTGSSAVYQRDEKPFVLGC